MAGASELGRVLASLPSIATRAVTALEQLEGMSRDGLVLADDTVAAIGRAHARIHRWKTVALWVIALAFLGILWTVR